MSAEHRVRVTGEEFTVLIEATRHGRARTVRSTFPGLYVLLRGPGDRWIVQTLRALRRGRPS